MNYIHAELRRFFYCTFRMFGTLREEKEGVKIIYGIALDQPNNFNILHHQVHHHNL
jgi:hypothetical protein